MFAYTYGIGEWGLPQREAVDMVWTASGGNHILACKRYPVRKLVQFDDDGNVVPSSRNLIPLKFIEALQHNQKIASCCRHPENHDIEAWYSCEEDARKGVPDIYIFHCTCGRKHRRFCVGGSKDPVSGEVTHPRPFWDVR